MSLNRFPVASALGFLKASPLSFRITRGKKVKYQEIRYLSSIGVHGWVSFLAPASVDDIIYKKLHVTVSISSDAPYGNTGPFATMTADRTLSLTGPDVINIVFTPDEATYRTRLAAVAGGSLTATTKTATSLVQSAVGVLDSIGVVQTFTLSDPFIDPLGGGKSIRAWQQQMVANLAQLKIDVDARIAADIASGALTAEDFWDVLFWNSVGGLAEFSYAKPDFKGAPEDYIYAEGETVLHYMSVGAILQIERDVDATGASYFKDVRGIEDGSYYPGKLPGDRLVLWGGSIRDDGDNLLAYYNNPDLIYQTQETIWCSQSRHRILAPVYIKLLVRPVLANPVRELGPFGPDEYGQPAALVTVPEDSTGRVEFDSACPANSIGGFWGQYADHYSVWQIYSPNPGWNVNGFVIPS